MVASYTPAEPWFGLHSVPYLERAQDERLPRWYRLECAMLSKLTADGAAWFRERELGELLGIGGVSADSTAVSREIREAKRRGLLAPESNSGKLVPPARFFKTAPKQAPY